MIENINTYLFKNNSSPTIHYHHRHLVPSPLITQKMLSQPLVELLIVHKFLRGT